VRTGGRYRFEAGTGTDCGGAAVDDALKFGAADTCFTSIGGITNRATVTANDYLVVFNLPTGTDKADAYQSSCGAACNKSQITAPLPTAGTEGDIIKFSSNTFTFESPGNRFFIIEGPVTYGCSGTTLTRYSGYGINAAQVAPPAGGSSAIMASNVAECTFTYESGVSAGTGLVTMRLKLSAQDSKGDPEYVYLYHSVHVNNVP
jgi:MSHA biogenesis protein MshO